MSPEPPPPQSFNRREFGRHLALGTLAVSTMESVPASATADEAKPAEANRPAVTAQKPSPDSSPGRETKPADDVTDLLVRIIAADYPDPRLTDNILDSIREEVDFDRYRGQVIREFPLENSDHPAYRFAAYRKDPLQ